MEEMLASKMKEFMTALDQVKKYRALLAVLPDFAIIMALSIIGWLSLSLLSKLGLVFVSYINTNWTPSVSISQLFVVVIGLLFGVFWVTRKVSSVKVGQWKNTLNEGTPGAIKLLQELKWDEIFNEIRYAKLGFVLYGIAKILVYWLIAAFISSFTASWLLSTAIHVNSFTMLMTMTMLALVLILFLSRKDLRRRYDQVGSLDALLWELRWFDNEFRRADFKA